MGRKGEPLSPEAVQRIRDGHARRRARLAGEQVDLGPRQRPVDEAPAEPLRPVVEPVKRKVRTPPKHESVPPEGTCCDEPTCGQPRGQGHPPRGWTRVYTYERDGADSPARWYCSALCAAWALGALARQQRAALTEAAIPPPNPEVGFDEALAWLNRAAGPFAAVQEIALTPERARRLVERVADGLEAEHDHLDYAVRVRLNACATAVYERAAVLEARDRGAVDDEPAPDLGEALAG